MVDTITFRFFSIERKFTHRIQFSFPTPHVHLHYCP